MIKLISKPNIKHENIFLSLNNNMQHTHYLRHLQLRSNQPEIILFIHNIYPTNNCYRV